jgi:hypothetical protein
MRKDGMKINKLKQRLRQDRPMTTATTAAAVSLRIPEDVVEDLQRIAPLLGFSGYQPLMRAYIGQGLRADLERMEGQGDLENLIASLRKHGVEETVIASAVAEAQADAYPNKRE